MAKKVTTNKKINNINLEFTPEFSESNGQNNYTQINTYLWDSSSDYNYEIPISDVQKLVHAVNINWDKPSKSAISNLIQLNNGNDIETTDDLIYVLEKLAHIALNGNNVMNGMSINDLQVIETNNGGEKHEKIYTYTAYVNNMLNENVYWQLTDNSTGNIVFDEAGSDVTELTGYSSISLKLNISKLKSERGNLYLPDSASHTNNSSEFKIYPMWNYNGTIINWTNVNNKEDNVVLNTSYENTETSSIRCTFKYDYKLIGQTIKFKLGSDNESNSISNDYFTINKKTEGNDIIVVIKQLRDLDSNMPGSTPLNIICSAKTIFDVETDEQLIINKTYTLASLGLSVLDETSIKNACIYVKTEKSTNTSEIFNELTNNLNLYLDLSQSSITVTSKNVNNILNNLTVTTQIGYPNYVYILIPQKYSLTIKLPASNLITENGTSIKIITSQTYNNIQYKVCECYIAVRNSEFILNEN